MLNSGSHDRFDNEELSQENKREQKKITRKFDESNQENKQELNVIIQETKQGFNEMKQEMKNDRIEANKEFEQIIEASRLRHRRTN